MKNMSARPYNPVHCRWQGQRTSFLDSLCFKDVPANSIWVWAMKLSSSKWLDPLAQHLVLKVCASLDPSTVEFCRLLSLSPDPLKQGEGHGRMDHIWDPQYQAVPSVPRTMLRWAVLRPARCLELMLYAPRKQSYNSFEDMYEAGLSWLGRKWSRKVGSFVVWSGRWYLGQAAAVLSPVPGLSNLSSPCCHSCYGFVPASPYFCASNDSNWEYPQMDPNGPCSRGNHDKPWDCGMPNFETSKIICITRQFGMKTMETHYKGKSFEELWHDMTWLFLHSPDNNVPWFPHP